MGKNDVEWPLSGDVMLPWTLWVKSLNQQLGFININNVESSDSETEKKIIEEVASYGRQLGWIIEVLDIVLSRHKQDFEDLTKEERASMDQFYDLIRNIEKIKKDSKSSALTFGRLDRMIDDIQDLKNKDEKTYRKMASKIKEAFCVD